MHPQCDEQILGVKLCREGGVGGGALVNQPEPVTDCCGKRNIYSPREQLCLPQRMCCRVEVLHGNEVCALVGGKHGGAGTGHECVDSAEPVGFILTAFERCVPVTDGQFRERMFDHKASARGIHHPDVGGDTTGERGCLRGFVGADEPRLPKKTEIFSGKDPPTITVCLRHDRTYHAAVIPPSITRSVPVMNEAASLARESAAVATSFGVPSRPSGCRATSCSRWAWGSLASLSSRSTHGESTVPGLTQLQRIPAFAHCTAMCLVRPTTAALLAQLAARSGKPICPATEAVFTITPTPRSSMPGIISRNTKEMPRTLTANKRSHSSGSQWMRFFVEPIPALLKSVSMGP